VLERRTRLDTGCQWLRAGGSVLFFGPDGSGKSIALEVLAAAVPGFAVLRCAPPRTAARAWRCARAGVPHAKAGAPYSALAELLSSMADPEWAAVSKLRCRLLASVTDQELGTTDTGSAARRNRPQAVHRATLGLLRAMAEIRPVLLLVDDLDCLDEASADVLRFVAHRVEDLPILMAAAMGLPDADSPPMSWGLCPSPLLLVRLDAISTETGYELDGEPGMDGNVPSRQGF
jgi:AAA ATPase domain